jgi:hypothetical protein
MNLQRPTSILFSNILSKKWPLPIPGNRHYSNPKGRNAATLFIDIIRHFTTKSSWRKGTSITRSKYPTQAVASLK